MGFVLVGGRSSRMGRDKALLPYRGRALVESVASTVAEVAGAAVLVGTPEIYGGYGYPAIPDLYPGEGPLGGILTALRHSRAEWNLVVACDMPALNAEILRRLFASAEGAKPGAVLPAGPSGLLEPLCALYHTSTRQAIELAFGRGVRKVVDALAAVPLERLAVPDAGVFDNVNTPDDWAHYAGH
jgi:molybdopterin-guanine dinucleotide biosynthesis protein A